MYVFNYDFHLFYVLVMLTGTWDGSGRESG